MVLGAWTKTLAQAQSGEMRLPARCCSGRYRIFFVSRKAISPKSSKSGQSHLDLMRQSLDWPFVSAGLWDARM